MLGWMKHKLESSLPAEISITLDMQMTSPLWQKVKRKFALGIGDGQEAWHAAVHGVAKSQTWLSDGTELNWTQLKALA